MNAVTVNGEVLSCLSEATLTLAKIGPLGAGRGFPQNDKLWELLEIVIATTSENPGGMLCGDHSQLGGIDSSSMSPGTGI